MCDRNSLVGWLVGHLMLKLAFLFREIFLLSPESSGGWRRCCVVRWWFSGFLCHLDIRSLISLHQNQKDLTHCLFIKCTEEWGWHELKQAVVGGCDAARRGVRTQWEPSGEAVGWGERPTRPPLLPCIPLHRLTWPPTRCGRKQAPAASLASHLVKNFPAFVQIGCPSHPV